MVVLVLVTQRHEDRLSQHREQLILDLVVLSEQKAAKVIQLLEEFRRDNPLIHNRVDQEANDMAQPANTLSVSDAIREVHVQADQTMGRCVNSDLSGPSMGRHRGFNNNE